MKKITSILFAVVAMALVTFSSCGKYEEGPGFSLRTKKARVVGEWVVEKELLNGQDVTDPSSNNFTLEFKKDDTYTISTGGFSFSGTWGFDSKKENLEISEIGSSTKTSSKILRLTNKEMWLVEVNGSDKYETHYKAK